MQYPVWLIAFSQSLSLFKGYYSLVSMKNFCYCFFIVELKTSSNIVHKPTVRMGHSWAVKKFFSEKLINFCSLDLMRINKNKV